MTSPRSLPSVAVEAATSPRYVRQVLLSALGPAGQARLEGLAVPLAPRGAAAVGHEIALAVASRYVEGAGAIAVAYDGVSLPCASAAPLASPAAQAVLAGALAAASALSPAFRLGT